METVVDVGVCDDYSGRGVHAASVTGGHVPFLGFAGNRIGRLHYREIQIKVKQLKTKDRWKF